MHTTAAVNLAVRKYCVRNDCNISAALLVVNWARVAPTLRSSKAFALCCATKPSQTTMDQPGHMPLNLRQPRHQTLPLNLRRCRHQPRPPNRHRFPCQTLLQNLHQHPHRHLGQLAVAKSLLGGLSVVVLAGNALQKGLARTGSGPAIAAMLDTSAPAKTHSKWLLFKLAQCCCLARKLTCCCDVGSSECEGRIADASRT